MLFFGFCLHAKALRSQNLTEKLNSRNKVEDCVGKDDDKGDDLGTWICSKCTNSNLHESLRCELCLDFSEFHQEVCVEF